MRKSKDIFVRTAPAPTDISPLITFGVLHSSCVALALDLQSLNCSSCIPFEYHMKHSNFSHMYGAVCSCRG